MSDAPHFVRALSAAHHRRDPPTTTKPTQCDLAHGFNPAFTYTGASPERNVFVSNCPGNRGLGHDQVSVSARASRPCRKAGAKHTRRGDRGEASGVRSRVPGKGKDIGRDAFQSRMTPCAAFEDTATSFRTWIPASAGFFVTPLTFSSSCCSYTACNIGGLNV